jgi:hypothetical protein
LTQLGIAATPRVIEQTQRFVRKEEEKPAVSPDVIQRGIQAYRQENPGATNTEALEAVESSLGITHGEGVVTTEMRQAGAQQDIQEFIKQNKKIKPAVDALKKMAQDLENDRFPSPEKLEQFAQAVIALRQMVPDNVMESAFPIAMSVAQQWLGGAFRHPAEDPSVGLARASVSGSPTPVQAKDILKGRMFP